MNEELLPFSCKHREFLLPKEGGRRTAAVGREVVNLFFFVFSVEVVGAHIPLQTVFVWLPNDKWYCTTILPMVTNIPIPLVYRL